MILTWKEGGMVLSFIEGNEAIARGAIAAGCSFFAGYPITPATSIYQHMLQLLPPLGGICMQGEDEIASIGFCLGAAMTGMQVMTATSGPGISLYSEQISLAIGGEIPLVIVDVQRLGPSTGSATKGADGDIQFLRWGNSGGLPVIVLAPVDVKDCYQLTLHAFRLAGKYRCPVFIASNKEIAMTRESVDLDPLHSRKSDPSAFTASDGSEEEHVPFLKPIGDEKLSRLTSSTHGPDGYITADSVIIAQAIERMETKLLSAVDDFTYFDLDTKEGDTILLVVYGVTARAARTALQHLRDMGEKVSLLVLKTLYPVPEKPILHSFDGKIRVVVIEMNLGQYVREIERLAGVLPVSFHGKMNGELISPEEIVEWVTQ